MSVADEIVTREFENVLAMMYQCRAACDIELHEEDEDAITYTFADHSEIRVVRSDVYARNFGEPEFRRVPN